MIASFPKQTVLPQQDGDLLDELKVRIVGALASERVGLDLTQKKLRANAFDSPSTQTDGKLFQHEFNENAEPTRSM
jgi:hypothetical protein